MKRTLKQTIEYNLNNIPYGTLMEQTLSEGAEWYTPFPVEMKTTLNGKGLVKAFPLYPGIFISFFDISADQVLFRGNITDEIMEIDFCRYGRVGLELENKSMLYLGYGDFSIHMVALSANSTLTMPLGYCEGVSVYIDLKKLSEQPPELLRGIGITGEFLKEKFCHDAIQLCLSKRRTDGKNLFGYV